MIVHLKKELSEAQVEKIATDLKAVSFKKPEHYVLVTPSSLKELNVSYNGEVIDTFTFDNDIQLASKKYLSTTRQVKIGPQTIGGDTNHTIMIAGPCSVESREQITESAQLLNQLGITTMRGGCYKPRTSPYSFQGLGLEGLELLAEQRDQHGFAIVTEVKDATHVHDVIEHADVIQVGAKAMYDQGILRACGQTHKPILIKRGFGSTLQEFVQAAEFVLSGGNENVVLCERGIRTFETKTRFTLDLCGVAFLKEHTNLPIILDPSHAMGYRYGIADLSRACTAMGVDGLLIEVHPDPSVAKSDAAQQLTHDQFTELYRSLDSVAQAIGRKIV